jgi:hypothetical protein
MSKKQKPNDLFDAPNMQEQFSTSLFNSILFVFGRNLHKNVQINGEISRTIPFFWKLCMQF